MALPPGLRSLTQTLASLPDDLPVTLFWDNAQWDPGTHDDPCVPEWVTPESPPTTAGELWTYPDTATALAVVWMIALHPWIRPTARRYLATPGFPERDVVLSSR